MTLIGQRVESIVAYQRGGFEPSTNELQYVLVSSPHSAYQLCACAKWGEDEKLWKVDFYKRSRANGISYTII